MTTDTAGELSEGAGWGQVGLAFAVIACNFIEILYHNIVNIKRERSSSSHAAPAIPNNAQTHAHTNQAHSAAGTNTETSEDSQRTKLPPDADFALRAAEQEQEQLQVLRGVKRESVAGVAEAAAAAAKQAQKVIRDVLLDILVLVAFPLAFISIRLVQARASAESLIETVGTGGLGSAKGFGVKG